MCNSSTWPTWHQQPFRLTCEEMDNPVLVLNSFFESYDLPKCRALLWEMQALALGGNAAGLMDGDNIGQWMFFSRHLEELIEAAQLLSRASPENKQANPSAV